MIRSTLLAGDSGLTASLGGHPQRLLHASGINPRVETDQASYLSFAALCEAIHEWRQFQTVHLQGAHSELLEVGTLPRWILHLDEPGRRGTRQKVAQSMGLACNVFRVLLGRSWHPVSVHFVQPAPADAGDFRRVFRTTVCFDQDADFMVLPRDALDHPIERSSPDLRRLLDRRDRRHPVRRTAHAAAAAPAARRYLVDSQLSPTQLAAILGYSGLSAYSRAFHRWHGQSPQRWQRSRSSARAIAGMLAPSTGGDRRESSS
jgi:AraC-like DNA-binding protein